MKEQDKTPEQQLNEVEIANLPEKEFRIMILKMIQNLGKRMEAKIEKMQEMFNKDLEELKNKQTESCTTMFIAALFTIARTWKQPKCPSTDEWIKKKIGRAHV